MGKTCPHCGVYMQRSRDGWFCPICGIVVDARGAVHPKKEGPVPPAPKYPYFVSYVGQTGYSGQIFGNAVFTSEEKIGHIQQIRQIEADIRKTEGCDRAVVLSVMPIKDKEDT